ncbi:sulfotransferase domain-containing protein [Hanstruepera neustonica]|uniref:sulfotransferase domain-containing protein n=1 Tax=Hanstruepera neustonica TaxID=1445657 RepID=UPI0013FDF8DD|nr:sulfotransferase domain-containing protein [Hanstruepera neustonica]
MNQYRKHIIIVGTARSGTSWLSETIAQQHRYRLLFEPEHETRTPKGYLLCDQWIEVLDTTSEAYRYLHQIFANRVDCDWIAQNSNRQFKRHLWPFLPKKYIIKFVRANLLAKYMNEAFGIPVIHMIRNPYDVLYSQQRANFPWLVDMGHFSSQKPLVDLVKNRFQFDLGAVSKLTTLELLTLRWCIENVIPLEVLKPYEHKHRVVRYENLFHDIQVFYDLCTYFDILPIKDIERVYKLPSSKTHDQSRIKTKQKPLLTFNTEELAQINGILDVFETKLYPRQY